MPNSGMTIFQDSLFMVSMVTCNLNQIYENLEAFLNCSREKISIRFKIDTVKIHTAVVLK